MEVNARALIGKYSNDKNFDMYYEPINDPKANRGMMVLMFLGPCNFKCKYCFFHNMEYQKADGTTLEAIVADIDRRQADKTVSAKRFEDKQRANIDFVTFSGSECTQYPYLIDIARAVKSKGVKIHLHTNGFNPDMLKAMFDEKLIDYIAMDIKANKKKYDFVTGVKVDIKKIDESITLVKTKSPEYKFRTTVCRELLEKKDIIEIGEWLVDGQWYELKGYWDSPIGRGYKQLSAYSHEEMVDMLNAVAYRFDHVTLLEGRRGIGGV